MIRYQGESIDFSIEIESEVKRWSDYTKVIVYFYTHTSKIAKFLYKKTSQNTDTSDTDYLPLTVQYNRFLKGTITPEYSKVMNGALLFDIIAYNKDTEEFRIKERITEVQVLYAPIKEEI